MILFLSLSPFSRSVPFAEARGERLSSHTHTHAYIYIHTHTHAHVHPRDRDKKLHRRIQESHTGQRRTLPARRPHEFCRFFRPSLSLSHKLHGRPSLSRNAFFSPLPCIRLFSQFQSPVREGREMCTVHTVTCARCTSCSSVCPRRVCRRRTTSLASPGRRGEVRGGGGERDRPAATSARLFRRRRIPRNLRAQGSRISPHFEIMRPGYRSGHKIHVATSSDGGCLLLSSGRSAEEDGWYVSRRITRSYDATRKSVYVRNKTATRVVVLATRSSNSRSNNDNDGTHKERVVHDDDAAHRRELAAASPSERRM